MQPDPTKLADLCEAAEGEEYLIRKGSYFYRPNAQGYTSSALEAGRYTLAEAQLHTRPNGPDGPRDGLHYIHESELPPMTQPDPRDVDALVERLKPILKRDGWGNVSEYTRHLPVMLSREGMVIVDATTITALQADVAALREALGGLIPHCNEMEKELTEKVYHADYCGESLPLCNARAALGQQP